ncbi:bifunctional folylpolyglutamate synthase/dihydrofolate synthase [Paeniglutamicibacter cryotolerans]|uniref:Dihydrofolate synthase/folylpolyglutamate synthase n=1 Tax=Paeniglutamicibacter cryotolerans TaxID=670079 RepID=A0A839QYB9_9MICC|nr:folylpolyglutamate synthase/dihydrofolate synthase family protein [Paeniglutamicibacter cryotolerans]MBB2996951.1 dihydrofolate synthase/folylpolyglutamate synthase [Paeniglutamicibacter cryotolerans]
MSNPTDDAFSVESVYAELLGRAPENKIEPRMEPMRRAMDILGEPNKAYPIIHVTGTNGKTSTARMIESLLGVHDLRTGRYSSPHLSKVTERIAIDGEPVDDATFVRIWDEIRPYLQIVDDELSANGENRLTYFEAVTILAFAVFADAPVDVAIIEVGLGGITDATNVGDGAVSVITPISLDHTDLLGDTTELIAQEKAGIIKPGGFLISAMQPADAAQVLLEKARELDVPFRFEGVEFGVESRTVAVGGQQLTLQGLADRYTDIFLPLHGAHQAQNAALALAALEAFLGGGERPLSVELVRDGFANATSPGRLEAIRTAPTVLLDAGHNPDGIRVSAEAIKESFGFSKLVLVVGILREKDAAAMLYQLREQYGDLVEDIALTQSNSPRAIPAGELADMAIDAGFREEDLFMTEKLDDALEWAIGRAEATDDFGGGVLVTGSITLVGEARTLLGGK